MTMATHSLNARNTSSSHHKNFLSLSWPVPLNLTFSIRSIDTMHQSGEGCVTKKMQLFIPFLVLWIGSIIWHSGDM
jgi:hypothetical protein